MQTYAVFNLCTSGTQHITGANMHGLCGKERQCQQPWESEQPSWGQSALKESGSYVQKLQVKERAWDGDLELVRNQCTRAQLIC